MEIKYGVWITGGGKPSRWMRDGSSDSPWSGSLDAAEMYAADRRPVYPDIQYSVKVFDPALEEAHNAEQTMFERAKAWEAERDELMNYVRNYTGFEAKPCPFCKWDNGKHVEDCGFHKRVAELEQLLAATDNVIKNKD